MANAWFAKDIRIKVPETVRYVLKGRKRPDVAAKDVMLVILASDYMKTSKGIGKVLEFAGDDLKNWPMDERATLTNMSVEAGGTTGIIEPDESTLDYVVKMRGLDPDDWKPMPTIGQGVREIRVRDASGAFRAIYLASFPDAVYVLHAFAKKAGAIFHTGSCNRFAVACPAWSIGP